MIPLIISLVLIAAVTVLLGRYSFRKPSQAAEKTPAAVGDCSACSILPSVCDNACAAESSAEPVVYFDDEELDRFRERSSDSYTDDEVEAFAEVLHTMREEEVPEWLESLKRRGILPPDELKEELVFFLSH